MFEHRLVIVRCVLRNTLQFFKTDPERAGGVIALECRKRIVDRQRTDIFGVPLQNRLLALFSLGVD